MRYSSSGSKQQLALATCTDHMHFKNEPLSNKGMGPGRASNHQGGLLRSKRTKHDAHKVLAWYIHCQRCQQMCGMPTNCNDIGTYVVQHATVTGRQLYKRHVCA